MNEGGGARNFSDLYGGGHENLEFDRGLRKFFTKIKISVGPSTDFMAGTFHGKCQKLHRLCNGHKTDTNSY